MLQVLQVLLIMCLIFKKIVHGNTFINIFTLLKKFQNIKQKLVFLNMYLIPPNYDCCHNLNLGFVTKARGMER
jgi:hypothetical protein